MELAEKTEKIALRLIARAEQCSAGLARKLERRGCEPSAVSAVISKLIELNLLDDGRYARLWLGSRLRLTRTPKRLLAGLCARGIGRGEAETALEKVLDEETELAMLARWVKKKKIAPDSIKYMLKNEGFNISVIQNFIKSI